MNQPVNELVCHIVRLLDEVMLEAYVERQAIMEVDGKLAREEASISALVDVLRRYPVQIRRI